MGGAAKALQRAFTPPKPDTPAPAPQVVEQQQRVEQLQVQQEANLAEQRRTAEAERKRLEAQEAATQRARSARSSGRVLLLNDELGIARDLATKVGG